MGKEVCGIFVRTGAEAEAMSGLAPASRASLLHLTRSTTTSSLGLPELTTGKVACIHLLIVKCNKSTSYELSISVICSTILLQFINYHFKPPLVSSLFPLSSSRYCTSGDEQRLFRRHGNDLWRWSIWSRRWEVNATWSGPCSCQ